MRARHAIAMGVIAVLTAACGQAPPSPQSSGSAPTGPSAAASTPASATPTQPPATLSSADPALVSGLMRAALASAPDKITTEIPGFGSVPALTQGMATVRSQYLRQYSWQKSREGFTLGWSLVAVSSDTIGIRLVGDTATGGSQVSAPAIVWFDARTDRVASSPALIKPMAWKDFTELVVQRAAGLDATRVRAALAADMAPRGTGPAIGFTQAGDVIVEFGGGTVADGPTSRTIVVPGGQATGLLSQLGTRAKAASAQPGAFDAATVAAKPAPEPETAPPVTASPPATGSAAPTASAPASATATPPSSPPASRTSSPAASASSSTPAVADDRPTTGVVPDCRKLKCVAITFDDGPMPSTPDVVAALTKAKVGATFFVLGEASHANQAAVRSLAFAGMDVQSHTFKHDQMTKKADAGLAQAKQQSDELAKIMGYRPWLIRPPYGDRNSKSTAAIGTLGAASAIWSVDTEDWRNKNAGTTTSRALVAASGDVILLHDIHPSTAAAVPGILTGLAANGFTVVSMSELAQPGAWLPGVAYCSSPDRAQHTC